MQNGLSKMLAEPSRKLKILILGDPFSVHSMRWVKQLRETEWDVSLFCPVAPQWGAWANNSYHKKFEKLSKELAPVSILTVTLNPIYWLLDVARQKLAYRIPSQTRLIESFLDNLLKKAWQKKMANILKTGRFQIVHSLGINQSWQNLCLPILEQKKHGRLKAPWIYSSWGTDLTFYPGLSPQNRNDVENIIQSIDYYISECKRDYDAALQFGFRGHFLGFFPAFGGVDLEKMSQYRASGLISERKNLYIKGRGTEDPVGRAMTILDALEKSRHFLDGYTIYIGQATTSILKKALELKNNYGLKISILPYTENPDEILNYIGSARISISITINDGLPASLVEAMTLGAFPIFSNLASIGEWIKHGENGFLADFDDSEQLAKSLQRALLEDELVNHASQLNAKIIQEKLDAVLIREKTIAMYRQVAKLSSH